MKSLGYALLLSILLIGFSCKKESASTSSTSNNNGVSTDKVYSLTGKVQKGPFVLGSAINLYELDKNLNQTGRSFIGNISNDMGDYSFKGIKLSSPYVLLVASGYYFNEVSGQLSPSTIQLNAIVDASDTNQHYVNILTQLGYERLKYLVGSGSTFSSAYSTSNTEVLKVFLADDANTISPDKLSVSGSRDPDAALLAISTICQGFRSQGDLMDLLSRISQDIKTDGKLDGKTTQSDLINDVKYVSLPDVRKNIVNRYSSLGMSIKPGNFEKYINRFIDSCNFTLTFKVDYPKNGGFGINILNDDSVYMLDTMGSDFSLAATIPKGMQVKISVVFPDSPGFYYQPSNMFGWSEVTSGHTSTFTGTGNGTLFDVPVGALGSSNMTINYYEGSITGTPTRVKKIRFKY